MGQKINLAAVGIITFLITYFSMIPASNNLRQGFSLLLHGVAYFALAGALLLYFEDTRLGHTEAIAFACFMGLGIEIFQYFLPFRTFALTDVAANSIGASVVALDHRNKVVEKVLRVENHLISRLFSE